jgi:hypothetical protein
VLDHHSDLAGIARAIGEKEDVTLVSGERHDDRLFGGAALATRSGSSPAYALLSTVIGRCRDDLKLGGGAG